VVTGLAGGAGGASVGDGGEAEGGMEGGIHCGGGGGDVAVDDWGEFSLDADGVTEFRVPETRYHVDAYNPETRTIDDYLGNHVHGYPPTHPQFSEDSKFLPGRPTRELYAPTMERLVRIATLGFLV